MFCMNCGLELSEDARFCRECAMPLTVCSECGTEIPKRAKYCWKCGKSQTSLSDSESQGSLMSDNGQDTEGVLPQHSESPMRFMKIGSANQPTEAPKTGAFSPFKPAGGAKRESKASAFSPAGTPSAFKPAAANSGNEEPAPTNTVPVASSPFKPISSAKTESRTTRPAAGARPSSVGSARPAARPEATSPAATRPAATRPAATRPAATRPAATRPAATRPAATRPAASAKTETEAPEAAPQTSAPSSPFKPVGTAKRESRTSNYNPAGTPSAFKPASEKKAKEAPTPKNTAPDVASPFKPIGTAKPETRSTRPAAASRPSSAGSARPAARAEAASKPSSVGYASKPVARPEVVKAEDEAPTAAPQAAVPSSPFKPISAAKTESRTTRPAAGSRPSSVGSARPAARPETAAEAEDETPAATSPFASSAAAPSSPFASSAAAAAPASPFASSAFKPINTAKHENKASPFTPAATQSAFNPVPEKKETEATVLAYKEEKAFTPLKPMSALRKEAEELTAAQAAAAANKPLASKEAEMAAPTLSAQITSSYSPFKPVASATTEPEKPAAASPFASTASSAASPFASSAASSASPFASPAASGPFAPLNTPEPEVESPISTSAFGSIAFSTAEPQDDSILIHKKPVDPTKMFNMPTNSGPMSTFGESSDSESLSSLGSSDFGSLSFLGEDSGSLLSNDFESSGEKLPQRSEGTSRFFPSPAAKTVTATPKMSHESSPFRQLVTETDDEKPFVREPGSSPFKPLR